MVRQNHKNRSSNEDREHPLDPNAKITMMKNHSAFLLPRTQSAYGGDMDTGAIVGETHQAAAAMEKAGVKRAKIPAQSVTIG